MTANTMRRIFRHFSHFGFRTGLQGARLHLHSHEALVRMVVPGIRHPLWARAGTSDAVTFDEVFLENEYKVPFKNFAPGHILDLGANVGYASVFFAARWPGAHILAVEPSLNNLAILRKNIDAWRNIECAHAAVWSRPTAVKIANPADDANAYRMSESSGSPLEAIQAFTIPQLMERLGCDRLGLLKMDIEGAEAEILQRGAEWLDRVDVMVIELHDRLVPGCAMALNEALVGRQYRQEILGSNLAFDFRK